MGTKSPSYRIQDLGLIWISKCAEMLAFKILCSTQFLIQTVNGNVLDEKLLTFQFLHCLWDGLIEHIYSVFLICSVFPLLSLISSVSHLLLSVTFQTSDLCTKIPSVYACTIFCPKPCEYQEELMVFYPLEVRQWCHVDFHGWDLPAPCNNSVFTWGGQYFSNLHPFTPLSIIPPISYPFFLPPPLFHLISSLFIPWPSCFCLLLLVICKDLEKNHRKEYCNVQ